MSSLDGKHSIQIQGNRLIFNWVKSTKDAVYPRYESVYRAFRSHWDMFARFASQTVASEIHPISYELTYVNELRKNSTSMLASVEEAVHVFRWTDIKRETIGEPSNLNFALNFDLPNGVGTGIVGVNPAKKAGSDGEEVLLFILKCVGPASGNPDEWFGMAHNWIVRGFAELTSQQAQNEWKREI
jgi:uncharacterized protein (TIGR04255 family)